MAVKKLERKLEKQYSLAKEKKIIFHFQIKHRSQIFVLFENYVQKMSLLIVLDVDGR